MSEELKDEVEAINSIYGDGCLVRLDQDPSIYILSLPDETSSLQLQFPATYPDAPPAVLGTHSSGEHGKRGAAARDLGLFRDAVADVYQVGQVCLFDAVEKLKELLEEATAEERLQKEASISETGAEENGVDVADVASEPTLSTREPPWVLSDPFVELKSTFVARSAAVSSPAEATQFVQHLLSSDKRVRTATHNITAWRIRGPNGTSFQDCDDDGETAAGGRLLHLMQLMDLWDTMVVVTRWYGGQKLGPRRFALINAAARDAFAKAGLVVDQAAKKKGHGKP